MNANRNERFLNIDSRMKQKMQDKLQGFKNTDVVTMDTASLAELSK